MALVRAERIISQRDVPSDPQYEQHVLDYLYVDAMRELLRTVDLSTPTVVQMSTNNRDYLDQHTRLIGVEVATDDDIRRRYMFQLRPGIPRAFDDHAAVLYDAMLELFENGASREKMLATLKSHLRAIVKEQVGPAYLTNIPRGFVDVE